MEQITVSSKGQIAIPKAVRDALNLAEGTKLMLEVCGHSILLSKDPAWKRLQGAAGPGLAPDLMSAFAKCKKQEREREDARP